MVGGFIRPCRGVEARRTTAREIDEEVQIEIPRISAEPRALQFWLIIGAQIRRRAAAHQASASLQYCTHFASSAITVEPSGTGYSNSMKAGKPYFSFFIICKISLICVSPCPHGIFSP